MSRFSALALTSILIPVLLLAGVFVPAPVMAGEVLIATGGPKSPYFLVGRAIADMANKYSGDPGLRFKAVVSEGSVENMQWLTSGKAQVAIVQSDRAHQAVDGVGPWKGKGKQSSLRSIMSLFSESVTLTATAASKIDSAADLKGMRVSLGPPESGTHQNALEVLAAAGLRPKDLGQALENDEIQASQMLLDGQLDAFFFTVGHPNNVIYRVMKGKAKLRFITIPCKQLRNHNEIYVDTWIPLKYYPKAANKGVSFRTCGVEAVLLTSEDVTNDVIYMLIKAVYSHPKGFRKASTLLSTWDPRNMLEAQWGLYAPHHAGAVQYLKEKKLPYKKLD